MSALNNPFALNAGTNHPGYLRVSVDLSSATWKSVASHEVFTVTGLVRVRMWIECTETLTDGADLADIQFGHEGNTAAFIAATAAAGKGGSTLTTGELWYDTSPTTQADTYANAVLDYVVNGLDIGYEITGEAMVDGTLVFHCIYEALSASGLVAAGAGGAL